MAVTPTSLLLCYQVYVDPVSFNVTLFGIFTSLRSTRFPTPSREYSVYALLQGEPGERGELRLECVDESTGAVLASHLQRAEIGALGKRHILAPLSEFRFPHPGVYRFALTFNDETIASQTIHVSPPEAKVMP